jgi:hypothetical protein
VAFPRSATAGYALISYIDNAIYLRGLLCVTTNNSLMFLGKDAGMMRGGGETKGMSMCLAEAQQAENARDLYFTTNRLPERNREKTHTSFYHETYTGTTQVALGRRSGVLYNGPYTFTILRKARTFHCGARQRSSPTRGKGQAGPPQLKLTQMSTRRDHPWGPPSSRRGFCSRSWT